MFNFNLEGLPQDADKCVVTLKQNETVISKAVNLAKAKISNDSVSVSFTQEETLNLNQGKVRLQVNAIIGESRFVSPIQELEVIDNLYEEVLK